MSQRSWVLALAAVASFMVALDTLVISTALTTIRADLQASVEELEWTVNAYNLSFAVLLMTASSLGDRFGRRRLFAAGLTLFALSSAACALAPSAGALIVARAVQGVGAAFVLPLALTLVGASAQAADAIAKSPSPAANIRRRPSRSPSPAAVISSTAKLRL